MERGKEVAGEFIEAGGDTTHVLASAEEAFDDVAQAVEALVVELRPLGGDPGGDDREGTVIADGLADSTAVISFVGNHRQRGGGMDEQFGEDGRVVRLATGDDEG